MSGGPLTAVLAAFRGGVVSHADAARVTGLPLDVVGASVGHLVRLGRLEAPALTFGCASGGCGTCPIACESARRG